MDVIFGERTLDDIFLFAWADKDWSWNHWGILMTRLLHGRLYKKRNLSVDKEISAISPKGIDASGIPYSGGTS